MKLRELQKQIEWALSHLKEEDDLEVVIPNNKDSVGRISCTKVGYASSGFDWESGLFIISPEKRMTEIEK